MALWVRVGLLAVVAGATVACSGQEPTVATAVSGSAAPTSAPAGATDEVSVYLEKVRVWVKCLHDNGIDVSDPDPTGQVTFPGDPAIRKSDPKMLAAQDRCAPLVPPVPESVLEQRKPKLSPEQIETFRKYADCMQTNGAPDFPDPGPDGYPPRDKQWDPTSPGAQKATKTCAPIIGDPPTPSTTQG